MRKTRTICIILIAVTLMSCNKESLDIDGHWHLFDYETEEYLYETLDILDSVAYMNKEVNGIVFPDCKIDEQKKELTFFQGRVDDVFRISIINDTLNFRSLKYDNEFFGVKDERCDRIDDYFLRTPVKVDLAETSYEDLKPLKRMSLSFGIYVGVTKSSERGRDTVSFAMKDVVLRDFTELEGHFERLMNYTPVNQRKNITIDVYADRFVKPVDLNLLIDGLVQFSDKPISIVVKYFNKQENLMVMMRIPVGKIPLDSKTMLKDLLR